MGAVVETVPGLPLPFVVGVCPADVGLATSVVPPVGVEPVPEEPHAATSSARQHKNNEIRNGRERIVYIFLFLHKSEVFNTHFFFYHCYLYAAKAGFCSTNPQYTGAY
jgi:hypothetical protein